MSTDIPQAVRDVVRKRSGGICESCGVAPATEMHHRLYRSRGGLHTASNLLDVCGWGNTSGCHGRAHSGDVGVALGLSIESGGDPRLIPVEHALFGWVLLTDEGLWEPVSQPDVGAGSDLTDWEIPAATKVVDGLDWS